MMSYQIQSTHRFSAFLTLMPSFSLFTCDANIGIGVVKYSVVTVVFVVVVVRADVVVVIVVVTLVVVASVVVVAIVGLGRGGTVGQTEHGLAMLS